MASLIPIPPIPISHLITRRSLLLSTTASPLSSLSTITVPPIDTTITDRVFLDFSICPNYFRTTTAISDPPCVASAPLGRVVIGLYGRLVPITVANFKTLCKTTTAGTYKNTLVHKILPGQFFVAGRQGKREKGEVQLPLDFIPKNTETVESKAFQLRHGKAGVVSLCLSENDDDEEVKLDPDYRNVEFLITTGPGPCPQLDNRNIVFGTVLQGMDVVAAIAAIPTYVPSERIRQFNELAEFVGDERAKNARSLWNRPLKSLYISDCGELKVTKPSLSPPSLP